MTLVPTVLEVVSAAKVRGFVLCVLTAGVGYAYYSASYSEDPSLAAGANGTIPPLVRAGPINSPPAPMHVIPEVSGSVAMPAISADRGSIARQLQTALAKAQCYDGPISGKWSAASQQAMGAFLLLVNARLPVGDPDPALLALVTSNNAAICSTKRPLYTGALSASASPMSEASAGSEPPTPEATGNSTNQQTPPVAPPMIERVWAPADMLVRPKDATPPVAASSAAATAPLTVGSAEPIVPSDAALTPEKPSAPVIHFEDSKIISDSAPTVDPKAAAPPKTAQRKAKSKHRASDYDDVSTSVSKSFKSIQRSLSSMFD